MKLLQYPFYCHDKNKESMQRMCKLFLIEYEATNSRERLQQVDYDILWLPMEWIEPSELPPTIKILYGPQHFVFPDPTRPGICGPEDEELSKRAIYTCLSQWNYNVFEEFSPWFKVPLCPFPFGVKELPSRDLANTSLDCIVYFKRRNPDDFELLQRILSNMGVNYKLFSYGSYQDYEYQAALQTTKCIVWFGTHESQGFAFQEALARNIPILVIDATTMFDEYNVYNHMRGSKELKSTTASWWAPTCGEKITSLQDLQPTLTRMLANLDTYSPASFVKENLTDKVCMKRILDAFGFTQLQSIPQETNNPSAH